MFKVKKYLIALIPFVVCTLLSLCFSFKDSNQDHPYRSELVLCYLAITWFFIGIIYSLMFFVIILLDDVFDRVQKHFKMRNLNKLLEE